MGAMMYASDEVVALQLERARALVERDFARVHVLDHEIRRAQLREVFRGEYGRFARRRRGTDV
jgi:hypothetical protein